MGEPIPTRYNYLRQQGFSDTEIEEYLGNKYSEAGFTDQEVNAYFAKHKLPGDLGDSVMRGFFNPTADPEENARLQEKYVDRHVDFAREGRLNGGNHSQAEFAPGDLAVREMPPEERARYLPDAGEYTSYGDVLTHGLQDSVSGMAVRGKLADSLTQREIETLPFLKRQALGAASIIGDLPVYAAGAGAGGAASGGNPLGAMGGAFGLQHALRAYYVDQISNGTPANFFEGLKRGGMYVLEGAKGVALGVATGAAGGATGAVISKLGGGAAEALAASAVTEAGTLTVVGAGMEGRIPKAEEFVLNVPLIFTMKAVSALGPTGARAVNRVNQDAAPKLRETYAATGVMPRDVVRDASTDPTILPDILSKNKVVPERYVSGVLERVKNGEQLPVSELEPFKDLPWGKAAIAEIEGPQAVSGRLAEMYNKAEQGDFKFPKEFWGITRAEDVSRLNDATGLNLQPGLVHSVDASAINHIIKNHGNAKAEAARGQLPVTAEDIAMVPEITRHPETIVSYAGKNANGLDVIRYQKRINGHAIVLEEVRNKTNQLALASMWKTKISKGSGGENTKTTEPSTPDPNVLNDTGYEPGGPMLKGDSAVSDKDITLASTKVNRSPGSNLELPYVAGREAGTDVRASLSDIVKGIGEALNVPIRTGKIAQHSAEGIYKSKSGVIRTRVANDISTIMHEAGHRLQQIVFGDITDAPLKDFASELGPIATKPFSGQPTLPEGFAEFVARYVVDPAEARRVAPKFFEHFEKTLEERNPEALQAFKDAQEGVRIYTEQPAMAEVLSHIDTGEGQGLGEKLAGLLQKETLESLKEKGLSLIVDDLRPLEKAMSDMAQGNDVPLLENAYKLARLYRGAGGKAEHFLERSPFKYDTYENVGKSFKGIIQDVENVGNIKEFRAYLVAKRAIELEARGKKSGLRLETAKEVVGNNAEKYDRMAKDLVEYQGHVLDYLVDSGVLSKDAAAAMREANKDYVPFFRVMDAQSGKGSGKGLTAKNPIRAIKGSGRDIIDPLESIIRNTYTMIDMAERNAVGRALVELAGKYPDNGGMVEKIPAPMKGQKIQEETILRAVWESSPEAYEMLKDALGDNQELSAMLFSRSNFIDKNNQISVFKDGRPEVYQVDPVIAEVMNGLGAQPNNLFMQALRILSIPTKTLRAGATLSLNFMTRNILRDTVHAGVQSRASFTPFHDSLSGLKEAATISEAYWRWKKAGGSQASLVSMDRDYLRLTVEQLEASGIPEKVWNVVKSPFDALRVLSELSEEATRLGEFKKSENLLGQTKQAQMQAALNSRDASLDFARMGSLTRIVNMLVPFTNATVQSWARIYETFRDNPARATGRAIALLSVPSIALAMHNYGDERLKEVPQWQKDIFWIFATGEGKDAVIWRIPKPFELGVMFASSAERFTTMLLDMYHGGDADKAIKEAVEGLGASMWNVGVPGVVPTVAMPFIENWANLSTFFDRPIIPADREGMLPEYQYAAYSTELTKSLASLVGDLSLFGREGSFSPAKAENFIQAWTGGLGMQALQLTDYALRKAGVLPDPVKPESTLADIPVINAFVVRFPSLQAESLEKFRKNYEKAQTYLQTITGLQKEMRYEDVQQYLPYTTYQALTGPNKALMSIYGTIKNIYRNPQISADEKRQLIDALTFQAIEIAEKGNEVFESVEDNLKQMAKEK